MYAVDKINQHINIEKILEHYNFEFNHSGGNYIRSKCKIHDGNNPTQFVISTENGLWCCHSCKAKGDIYTLVQIMEEISFVESVTWVANFFDVDIDNLKISERKEKWKKDVENFIKTIKGVRKKDFEEYHIVEEVKRVKKFRNFCEETLKHFGFGYVKQVELLKRNGDPYTLKERLVFPIIFNSIQVAIAFRRVYNQDKPKWSNQPVSFDFGSILYNYDAIIKNYYTEFVIVEGITDVWAYYELGIPAVCTFGSHLTDMQAKLILKSSADTVTLSYDNDEAGCIATKKAIEKLKYRINIKQVQLPIGSDPCDLGREELHKLYQNRIRRA